MLFYNERGTKFSVFIGVVLHFRAVGPSLDQVGQQVRMCN